jgi:hypothetical protein
MTILATSNEAIDAVGGTGAYARWWGVSDSAVSIWRTRGFPARTFLEMQERLRDEFDIEVSPAAWKMILPTRTTPATPKEQVPAG